MTIRDMDNPRFPHRCRIYRQEGVTSFDDGQVVTLYEGVCRKYKNASFHRLNKELVSQAAYELSLPGTVAGICKGDLADVTDRKGERTGLAVVDCYAGNLGTTVWLNEAG